MSIQIHQAYYGEQRSQHTLLAASGNRSLFERLTIHTDRPDNPPADWPSYVSGFPFEDHYVLARTSIDPSAERDMIFTHALLLREEDVREVRDLRPLFALLDGPELRGSTPAPISRAPEHGTVKPPAATPRIAAAVHTRLQAPREQAVVWLGYDGFEELLACLWWNLWPEARRQLRFRISFSKADTHRYGFTFVSTADATGAKWRHLPVVGPGAARDPGTDRAEALLLGLPAGAPLRAFLDQTGARPDDLLRLRRLAHASHVWEQLEEADFSETLGLLRILSVDAATPASARVKEEVLARLVTLVPEAGEEQVLALRNVKEDRVSGGLGPLPAALAENVTRGAAAGRVSAPTLIEAFDLAGSGGATAPWWRATVREGVEVALSRPTPPLARQLWRWWTEALELVRPLFVRLGEAEPFLSAACPDELPETLGETILGLAAERGWWQLHAAVALAAYPAATALRLHLDADRDTRGDSGVRELARRLRDRDLVEAALAQPDPRLLTVTAERVRTTPALLGRLDVRDATWRDLWARALDLGLPAWAGVRAPAAVRDQLLDLLLAGEDVDVGLQRAIGASEHADLSLHPRLSALWPMLEPETRSACLRASAAGWLRHFYTGSGEVPSPDPQLRREVLRSPDLFPRSAGAPADLEGALRLVEALPDISERAFADWLSRAFKTLRPLPDRLADRLGSTVLSRRWTTAARTIAGAADARHDLLSVARRAMYLLPWLERIGLHLKGIPLRQRISEDEWWDELLAVAIDFFPEGPNQEHVWEDAGGHRSELPTQGSGAELWRAALRLLRQGAGDEISAHSLISVMRRRRSRNPRVRALSDFYS